jgi:hypothetical protein
VYLPFRLDADICPWGGKFVESLKFSARRMTFMYSHFVFRGYEGDPGRINLVVTRYFATSDVHAENII